MWNNWKITWNLQKLQLTTVEIFLFFRAALIKHLYSEGAGTGFLSALLLDGLGFVRPSSADKRK